MKFSVIIGNPPYQGARVTDSTKGKPPTIWGDFVSLSNGLLEDDGALAYLHPAMYRKPGNELQDIIYKNNRVLKIFNNADAGRVFGVSSRFDWYVVDKKYEGTTRVTFEDRTTREVQLDGIDFLPNGSMSIWDKVRDAAARVGFIQTRKIRNTVQSPGDYKFVQTIVKKGVEYATAYRLPEEYYTRKVIISETTGIALYDEGELGLSCNCYMVAVESEEEGRTLVNFVNSRLVRHLILSCRWGNFRVESCLFHQLPNPSPLGLTPTSTEEEIQNSLGIDVDEQEFIDTFRYGQTQL